ncbi:uncharacterized protein LOC112507123 [Cynara cardunculus var. scolymus]|uniref:uncharacterized protein LOC112507123 n=1 Tax=Cynara cardunculus var. scolymus TaxID=59895 RepID=UPI000D62784B|nr:uncharacterized protein LOC112507123 [Cynara cardunculus var. scolymus]
MEKKSWVCTVSVQLILCFALYCAINMDQLQTPTYRNGAQGQPDDIYFITVRGGFRPLKQQTRLLKQIEKVMNTFKVGFVININELGEDDPLLQNATQYFHSSKVPWYTTMALREEEPEYFFKQVNVSSGIMLDIIALNTGKIQDSSSGIGKGELEGLSRKLELSNSNWHIALGFHPLSCNQTQAEGNGNGVLLEMLLNHGVDAYLSGRSCANEARVGGPHLTTITQESHPPKEMVVNMFLLHRVSPLEIATYGVSFKGDMIHESTLRQRGSEMM